MESRIKRVKSRAEYAMRVLDSINVAGDYCICKGETAIAKVFVGDIDDYIVINCFHTRDYIGSRIDAFVNRIN